jgi:hypothetical protein
MIFAGFSFGAAVGSRAACPDSRIKAIISAGTPVSPVQSRSYDFKFFQDCTKPKLFVSGEHDVYGPRGELDRLVETVPAPKKLIIVPAADHFFEGRLKEMREAIEQWVAEVLR